MQRVVLLVLKTTQSEGIPMDCANRNCLILSIEQILLRIIEQIEDRTSMATKLHLVLFLQMPTVQLAIPAPSEIPLANGDQSGTDA
jgi:hypothetical protein